MSETNEESLEQMQEENGGNAVENLVTIATFPDPAQASLARAALESAGILSFLQGENANTLIPVAFLARLQVRAEDEAAALSVLQDAEFGSGLEDNFDDVEPADEEAAR